MAVGELAFRKEAFINEIELLTASATSNSENYHIER